MPSGGQQWRLSSTAKTSGLDTVTLPESKPNLPQILAPFFLFYLKIPCVNLNKIKPAFGRDRRCSGSCLTIGNEAELLSTGCGLTGLQPNLFSNMREPHSPCEESPSHTKLLCSRLSPKKNRWSQEVRSCHFEPNSFPLVFTTWYSFNVAY